MKQSVIMIGMLGSLLAGTAAQADNQGLENALQKRPEFSSFYAALVNTGVNHELKEGMSYTVFAPTNDAFARIRQDRYPCFYMAECRAEVASIVRNHIVPHQVYLPDAAKQKGGVHSISGRFVHVGKTAPDDYTVDGNNASRMIWVGSNLVYQTDGVIASPRELAALTMPEYASAERVTTTTTERTIPNAGCGPEGCSDASTQTTTIRRTATTRPYQAAPLLEPAAR